MEAINSDPTNYIRNRKAQLYLSSEPRGRPAAAASGSLYQNTAENTVEGQQNRPSFAGWLKSNFIEEFKNGRGDDRVRTVLRRESSRTQESTSGLSSPSSRLGEEQGDNDGDDNDHNKILSLPDYAFRLGSPAFERDYGREQTKEAAAEEDITYQKRHESQGPKTHIKIHQQKQDPDTSQRRSGLVYELVNLDTQRFIPEAQKREHRLNLIDGSFKSSRDAAPFPTSETKRYNNYHSTTNHVKSKALSGPLRPLRDDIWKKRKPRVGWGGSFNKPLPPPPNSEHIQKTPYRPTPTKSEHIAELPTLPTLPTSENIVELPSLQILPATSRHLDAHKHVHVVRDRGEEENVLNVQGQTSPCTSPIVIFDNINSSFSTPEAIVSIETEASTSSIFPRYRPRTICGMFLLTYAIAGLASLTVSITYAALAQDTSGGFTVGAYMVAVTTMVIMPAQSRHWRSCRCGDGGSTSGVGS